MSHDGTSWGSRSIEGKGAGEGEGDFVEIPSTGLAFFEYRRSLFLAARPTPPAVTDDGPLAPTLRIPAIPPPPLPPLPYDPSPTSGVGKLERLLAQPGAEESEAAWRGGVEAVSRHLGNGKRLAKGLRLGLGIKILKATWIQDGTWPIDRRTGRPAVPPDSPTNEIVGLDDMLPVRHAKRAAPPPLSATSSGGGGERGGGVTGSRPDTPAPMSVSSDVAAMVNEGEALLKEDDEREAALLNITPDRRRERNEKGDHG